MKKIIYIVILLSLLGCNKQGNDKNILLTIQAGGEIESVPDMASITARVSCLNQDLAKSNDCTKKGIDELFKLLDVYKIAKDDYHSSRIDLRKEHIWRKNSQVFNGYRSSSSVNITFRNLDIMGEVTTKVMSMSNVEVSGLNYSHSEIDALMNKAYLAALDNSNSLAEEFKNKLGAKSVEVLEINNTSNNFSRPRVEGFAGLRESKAIVAGNSSIQINPGSLKLVKNIYVLYRVKP